MRRAVDYSGEIEAKLRAEGLVPVRSENTIALGYGGKVPVDARALAIASTRPGIEAALQALGHTYRLANTRPIGNRGAPEVWVTPAVHADLRAVEAARMHLPRTLHYSFPGAARRLAEVPETFRSFCAALALGASANQLTTILAHVPEKHCVTCTCGPRATPIGRRAKTGGR